MVERFSNLHQGQELDAVFGPENEIGEYSFGKVGRNGVTRIVVKQLAGPMGFYDVAVIVREDTDEPDEIIPLHMAEFIRLKKGPNHG
ncbi:hypothetical protein [Maritimibacter sp. DP1N21-5]|uniref:hypothetical protein n=1 Tax=Maritimibacter sp. DP1N21-5 TaxID=2836867 RepID=UPI001C463560|nr:hypothetical protein [Maritimibacter sp. DP1N21-5]MBV7408717.1 hypothetical protein [Maritimibacter sp. DP1N21-5]